MRMVVPGGRIFGGVVQEIEQHLLEQDRIDVHHRQVGCKLQFDAMAGKDLARAAQRAADDLAEIVRSRIRHDGAGFELGHVEQVGDEAIEPLGFVDDGREQVGLFGIASAPSTRSRSVPGRPEHGRKRRLEIVRDRGEQRGTQPIGLDGALRAVDVLDQAYALDRERGLIDQAHRADGAGRA